MILFDKQKKIFYSDRIAFIHGFTTKLIGVGKDFKQHLQIKNETELVFTPEQIHGDTVVVIDKELLFSQDIIPVADALVYVKKIPAKVCLYARSADCLPIILFSKERQAAAVVHSGWKGSLLNIVGKTVEAMVDVGVAAEEVIACIGPGIAACCYTISSERELAFRQKYPKWQNMIIAKTDTRPTLSLLKLVYLQLIEAGVSTKNIDWKNFCTSCQTELFFSYRKYQGRLKGENFSFICL